MSSLDSVMSLEIIRKYFKNRILNGNRENVMDWNSTYHIFSSELFFWGEMLTL